MMSSTPKAPTPVPLCVWCMLCILMLSMPPASAQTYTLTDLGPQFIPRSVNKHGIVCGQFKGRPGRWKPGWTIPQYLPGANTPGACTGVNNYDQYVGWREKNGVDTAFYFGSTYATIQTPKLPPGTYFSAMHAINDDREVVGFTSDGSITSCAMRWPTPTTPPTCLWETNEAPIMLLNNAGKAVAIVPVPEGEEGVAWTQLKGSPTLTWLPEGTVTSLNSLGWEAGHHLATDRARLLPNNTTRDVAGICPDGSPSPQTLFTGINQAASAVGWMFCGEEVVPFRWDHWTNTFHPLNTLITAEGWDLSFPMGLGFGGHIFGQGAYHGELAHFLLTPVSAPAQP